MDDLIVGQFLGKGSFADVFEVFTTVVLKTPTLESSSDKDHLNKLIDAKFHKQSKNSLGDSNEDSSHAREVERGDRNHRDDLDDEIDAMFGSNLDDEIGAMFRSNLDEDIDAMLGCSFPKEHPQANHKEDAEQPNQNEAEAKLSERPCKKTQERKITLAMKR